MDRLKPRHILKIGLKRKKMSNSREWNTLPSETQEIIRKFQNESKVQLGAIAKELGLDVKLSTLPAFISGEIRHTPDDRFAIKINRHEAKVRQRFTLAHEIAHFLLHKEQIVSKEGIEDNVMYRSSLSNTLEAQANRLAADIVMPWHIVQKEVANKNLEDEKIIQEIAENIGVSVDAFKIRIGRY